MKSRVKGHLQLIVFFGFIALLVWSFPYVARIAEASAMNIRKFWWVILILALGGLSIWALGKKRH